MRHENKHSAAGCKVRNRIQMNIQKREKRKHKFEYQFDLCQNKVAPSFTYSTHTSNRMSSVYSLMKVRTVHHSLHTVVYTHNYVFHGPLIILITSLLSSQLDTLLSSWHVCRLPVSLSGWDLTECSEVQEPCPEYRLLHNRLALVSPQTVTVMQQPTGYGATSDNWTGHTPPTHAQSA